MLHEVENSSDVAFVDDAPLGENADKIDEASRNCCD